jgi:hypothetical protein
MSERADNGKLSAIFLKHGHKKGRAMADPALDLSSLQSDELFLSPLFFPKLLKSYFQVTYLG